MDLEKTLTDLYESDEDAYFKMVRKIATESDDRKLNQFRDAITTILNQQNIKYSVRDKFEIDAELKSCRLYMVCTTEHVAVRFGGGYDFEIKSEADLIQFWSKLLILNNTIQELKITTINSIKQDSINYKPSVRMEGFFASRGEKFTRLAAGKRSPLELKYTIILWYKSDTEMALTLRTPIEFVNNVPLYEVHKLFSLDNPNYITEMKEVIEQFKQKMIKLEDSLIKIFSETQ